MAVRVKMPQASGLRASVEVQHGRRGVALMLRRGLHGAKNWVLEREDDGSHRSVWTKLFRAMVVLTPLWIVLSVVTGGPERGGHSANVGQSLFMAVLVMFIGLALFSARERKLGREEPWAELKSDSDDSTESDDGEEGAAEESDSESPTQVLENSQVEEAGSVEPEAFRPDENAENEQKTQILPVAVPQAIETEAETVVITGLETVPQGIQEPVYEATPESSVDHGVPQGWNAPAEVSSPVLDKAVTEDLFTQVTGDIEKDWPTVPQAVSEDPSGLVTESERNDLPDTPTVPFRPVSRIPVRETEEPQVEAGDGAIRETVQAEFQCLYAADGPYPASPDPVHESWWVTAPDLEEDEEPQEAAEEAPEPAPDPDVENASYDPWSGQQEAVEEHPVTPLPAYPQEVQRYFASRISTDVDDAEREAARIAVMAWAVAEVNEGRRSQSEVARMLGIGKATVSRWVNTGSDDVVE